MCSTPRTSNTRELVARIDLTRRHFREIPVADKNSGRVRARTFARARARRPILSSVTATFPPESVMTAEIDPGALELLGESFHRSFELQVRITGKGCNGIGPIIRYHGVLDNGDSQRRRSPGPFVPLPKKTSPCDTERDVNTDISDTGRPGGAIIFNIL